MGSYKWGYKYRVTIIITLIRGRITPLITAHEPSSAAACKEALDAVKRMKGSTATLAAMTGLGFRLSSACVV